MAAVPSSSTLVVVPGEAIESAAEDVDELIHVEVKDVEPDTEDLRLSEHQEIDVLSASDGHPDR